MRTIRHGDVQLNTAPDSPPTSSTNLIALWQHDSRGLYIERFFGFKKVSLAYFDIFFQVGILDIVLRFLYCRWRFIVACYRVMEFANFFQQRFDDLVEQRIVPVIPFFKSKLATVDVRGNVARDHGSFGRRVTSLA